MFLCLEIYVLLRQPKYLKFVINLGHGVYWDDDHRYDGIVLKNQFSSVRFGVRHLQESILDEYEVVVVTFKEYNHQFLQ